MNEAFQKDLVVGSKVWYKQKEYKVVITNPQGLYMIKNRRGDVHWVRPNQVMQLSTQQTTQEGVQ